MHHDIWDADLAAAPALIDVKQGGKTIPAVAVINKSGLLFLLDRVTGKPIYGVEERPVPQSEVPLERPSKTQPFPLKPAPLSRMTMTMADIATVTPELEAACRKLIEGVQLGGPYLPQGYNRLRLQFPGNHGGVNWGGASFNPQLGYLFVNTNEFGQLAGVTDRDPNDAGQAQGDGAGNRVDPDGPYRGACQAAGASRTNATNMMCQQPPWGTADGGQRQHRRVRLARAARHHRKPAAGEAEHRPAGQRRHHRHGWRPRVRRRHRRRPVPRVRREDGKELWTVKLGGAANATPSTYLGKDGKQYVVITSTGGGFFDAPLTDDSIMAFAVPARP